MKVLKHGNTYNEMECPKCHCIFEYVRTDIDYIQTGAVKGKGFMLKKEFTESVVHCPECNAWITINKERNKFFDEDNVL